MRCWGLTGRGMEWAQHGRKINSQGRAWIPAAMIRKSRTITAFYSLTSCWACNKTPMQTSGIPSTIPKPSERRGVWCWFSFHGGRPGECRIIVRFVPFFPSSVLPASVRCSQKGSLPKKGPHAHTHTQAFIHTLVHFSLALSFYRRKND